MDLSVRAQLKQHDFWILLHNQSRTVWFSADEHLVLALFFSPYETLFITNCLVPALNNSSERCFSHFSPSAAAGVSVHVCRALIHNSPCGPGTHMKFRPTGLLAEDVHSSVQSPPRSADLTVWDELRKVFFFTRWDVVWSWSVTFLYMSVETRQTGGGI